MNDWFKILINKLTLGVEDSLGLLIPATFYYIVQNFKFCLLSHKVTPYINNEGRVKVNSNIWSERHSGFQLKTLRLVWRAYCSFQEE